MVEGVGLKLGSLEPEPANEILEILVAIVGSVVWPSELEIVLPNSPLDAANSGCSRLSGIRVVDSPRAQAQH